MSTALSAAAPRGPALTRLAAVELRKMTDTRAGFWLLVLTGLAAAAAVLVGLIWAPAKDATLAGFLTATVEAMGVLLPVLAILAVTSEWTQRTALTTFTLVPRRERVVAAKLLAAVALALLAFVVCLLTAAVAALAAPAFGEAGAGWDLALSDVGRATLFQVLGVLAGTAWGLALMRSAPAITVYFLAPMVFSALIAAIPGFADAAGWLDVSASLGRLVTHDGTLPWEAWAQLATGVSLWLALPLAIGFARLRRSEVAA
jgi:ABC-2 type transport system permease protein